MDAGTLSIVDIAPTHTAHVGSQQRNARIVLQSEDVFPAPARLWYRRTVMAADKSVTEKILHVLRPYASNWSGTLGRGDLVIPQREIPRVIHEILNAVHELTEVRKEAPEGEVLQVLMESRRLSSVQDQLRALQKRFLIIAR